MTTGTKRVLVTGGSGFIGTNLIISLLSSGQQILSIDTAMPQEQEHKKIFKKINILDQESLNNTFNSFLPTHVIHLAARTDLHEKKNIEGYRTNIDGVKNIISAITQQQSVKKCIFTSTKLVCPTNHTPKSNEDYCPDTLYGKSKVLGEQIVQNSTELHCDWCIVRPTSIWGPWSMSPHIPYGKFFQMIAKGKYFHPGKHDPPKSFGYVGNTVFQIQKLLEAPGNMIHRKVFYLSDYDKYTIKEWANIISLRTRNKTVPVLPEPIVRLAAWCGDVMKLMGFQEPPFSTFRLENMRADTTGVPLVPIKEITGILPYTLEQGVDETISWLKKGYID
jgi:nucleoside-diphosphate-sugar epimerase